MSGFLSVFSLVVAVSVYFFYLLTIVDLEWSQITVEMIASSQHPAVISEQILLVTRVLFSIIIWASIVYIVTDPVGLEITVQNADGSKRTHLFKGLDRLTMFTVWSWILQVILIYSAYFPYKPMIGFLFHICRYLLVCRHQSCGLSIASFFQPAVPRFVGLGFL